MYQWPEATAVESFFLSSRRSTNSINIFSFSASQMIRSGTSEWAQQTCNHQSCRWKIIAEGRENWKTHWPKQIFCVRVLFNVSRSHHKQSRWGSSTPPFKGLQIKPELKPLISRLPCACITFQIICFHINLPPRNCDVAIKTFPIEFPSRLCLLALASPAFCAADVIEIITWSWFFCFLCFADIAYGWGRSSELFSIVDCVALCSVKWFDSLYIFQQIIFSRVSTNIRANDWHVHQDKKSERSPTCHPCNSRLRSTALSHMIASPAWKSRSLWQRSRKKIPKHLSSSEVDACKEKREKKY